MVYRIRVKKRSTASVAIISLIHISNVRKSSYITRIPHPEVSHSLFWGLEDWGLGRKFSVVYI